MCKFKNVSVLSFKDPPECERMITLPTYRGCFSSGLPEQVAAVLSEIYTKP